MLDRQRDDKCSRPSKRLIASCPYWLVLLNVTRVPARARSLRAKIPLDLGLTSLDTEEEEEEERLDEVDES